MEHVKNMSDWQTESDLKKIRIFVVVDLLFNVLPIVCWNSACLCFGMHFFVSFLDLQSS